jgi:hypothetical protein
VSQAVILLTKERPVGVDSVSKWVRKLRRSHYFNDFASTSAAHNHRHRVLTNTVRVVVSDELVDEQHR